MPNQGVASGENNFQKVVTEKYLFGLAVQVAGPGGCGSPDIRSRLASGESRRTIPGRARASRRVSLDAARTSACATFS